MIIYKQRPKARRAKKVWDYATNRFGNGNEPISLWKNPNCWGGDGSAYWGFWMAEFHCNQVLPEFIDIADAIPIGPWEVD